eukprot:3203970-Lingulodinium_polyedra.AAC.1
MTDLPPARPSAPRDTGMPSSSSRAARKATASGTSWNTPAARPTRCKLMSSTYLRSRTAGHSASA